MSQDTLRAPDARPDRGFAVVTGAILGAWRLCTRAIAGLVHGLSTLLGGQAPCGARLDSQRRSENADGQRKTPEPVVSVVPPLSRAAPQMPTEALLLRQLECLQARNVVLQQRVTLLRMRFDPRFYFGERTLEYQYSPLLAAAQKLIDGMNEVTCAEQAGQLLDAEAIFVNTLAQTLSTLDEFCVPEWGAQAVRIPHPEHVERFAEVAAELPAETLIAWEERWQPRAHLHAWLAKQQAR